jgi:hypothetical protein
MIGLTYSTDEGCRTRGVVERARADKTGKRESAVRPVPSEVDVAPPPSGVIFS